MADQTQVDRLKAGVEGWNEWREANPKVKADLSSANLNYANLSGANLNYAVLIEADMRVADMHEVDMTMVIR